MSEEMCRGLECGDEIDNGTPFFHYKPCHIFQFFSHKHVL